MFHFSLYVIESGFLYLKNIKLCSALLLFYNNEEYSKKKNQMSVQAELRREIASLRLFYRLHDCEYFEESFDLIPSSLFYFRNICTGLRSHRFMMVSIMSHTNNVTNSYFCGTDPDVE